MKTEKQQQAQNLYLHTDITQAEIADMLDINTKTLYLWIKNGRWEQAKHAAAQAEDLTLMEYYNHIQVINTNIRERENKTPTIEEINMLSKLQRMSRYSSKYHTSLYMQSFEELLRFINVRDHDFCKKVALYADEFIRGAFADPNHLWHEQIRDTVKKVIQNQPHDLDYDPESINSDKSKL